MKIKYLLVLIVLLSITFVGCGTRQNMPTEEQSVRYTADDVRPWRSEEHTSELQSRE